MNRPNCNPWEWIAAALVALPIALLLACLVVLLIQAKQMGGGIW